MPSNVTGDLMRELVARFPGKLQNLHTPSGGWFTPWVPYALDNGAFGAWKNGQPFDELAFLRLCDKAALAAIPPRWVAVPDVVGDWPGTLQKWEQWAPLLRSLYGWDLALCVQDGATVEDVRAIGPELVFVGGSTSFKWGTFRLWCATFRRVHVGRVNRVEWALDCARAGVESIDGTGWMRTTRQRKGLVRILEYLAQQDQPPPELGVEAA
jgi:hypothetical protein